MIQGDWFDVRDDEEFETLHKALQSGAPILRDGRWVYVIGLDWQYPSNYMRVRLTAQVMLES